ncbi:alkaline phosphatase family protein [Ferroacidibacillus organovorans]|uniref:Nucleotide pyrophosphatase n=1 Tax=Ferroacidibacillus organovorans TaxID=1765683 RepID=A0A101XNG0_9BACL|nr:alkaline phosphatase family protein [Ferroacidibacillus organovorans]KUO94664.1 hypothetical protein ATW55_02005 [Ferroacidibacillus organovorans]
MWGLVTADRVNQNRLIVVLIDGLSNEVAQRHLGYMEGLVEEGIALRARVKSILPSLSRPCYASIFTGTPPQVHGVTTNEPAARLETPSVFDLLAAVSRTSAVAGYHWMSELFSRGPYDLVRDVEQSDNESGITHGRFYHQDEFPDAQLFGLAERMRRTENPDLLVIHPMGCDHAGHKHGSASREYAGRAAFMDGILATVLPVWMREGYQIIVTADHGMNAFGFHGGPDEAERITPFYLISQRLPSPVATQDTIEQTELSALFCDLLGISPSATMRPFSPSRKAQWFGL